MAEVRGEAGPGEVFGRPLSDFDEPPPVLLECMGWVSEASAPSYSSRALLCCLFGRSWLFLRPRVL